MTDHSVSIVLTGSGGAGVMTAGNMLSDAAAKAGWYAYMTRSSGPQIRGGEAAAMLRLSPDPVLSHDDRYDILVAIDWENVERFAAEMPLDSRSLVLCDADSGAVPAAITAMGPAVAELPMKRLAKAIKGGRPNMIALGAVIALAGIPPEALLEVLGRSLKAKGEEALEASAQAVQAGIEAAQALPATRRLGPPRPDNADRWLATGNQLTGLGALRAGVRFVGAYPITPATEVLEWMAPALEKAGGVLVQAEDELASINMVIGASYGGTPSLTATSGPGLSLMTESLGLAVASETPLVVVDVMRGGPSTGIPTKSEQSDLNIAVYGLHGDAPHVVVAPVDLKDCLFTTQWAVHLAEALQTPAIVLSDQALGQARAVIDRPPTLPFKAERVVAEAPGDAYRRYAVTESGVSPMALPGMAGGQYTADGLEHNPRGIPSSQASDHLTQMDKRRRKIDGFDYGEPWALIEGAGDIAVITWGSCTGVAREAMARAAAQGVKVRLIAPRLLAPARPEAMERALDGVSKVLVVEQSHGGQFHRLLRAFYDLPRDLRVFARPGPLPIRPQEVLDRLLSWSEDR